MKKNEKTDASIPKLSIVKIPLIITLTFLMALFNVFITSAGIQQQQISGIVTDATSGETLPGVNVRIEGTIIGAATDIDGQFRLATPGQNSVLVFSFIGYITQNVTYTGQTNFEIKLVPDVEQLEEVVVIGYGTMRKTDVTGSVSSVRSADLEKANLVTVQGALQGRASGVIVSSNSGSPGTEATVRIRGIGTVNGNDPIYVVDGTMVTSMNYLNPSDIETIDVLKDASATAIYGSRGANGVILITTKKGKSGKAVVNFDSNIGFVNPTTMLKLLNSDQYFDMIKTSVYNGYIRSTVNPDPNWDPEVQSAFIKAARTEYDKGYNTDWIDAVLTPNALQQNYSLSVSGGSDNIKYAFSAGALDQKGIIKNSGYSRGTIRLNTEFKVNKFLVIGENLGISTSKRDIASEGTGGAYGQALFEDPLTPILKPLDEVDITDPNYEYIKYAGSKITTGQNPVAGINYADQNSKNLSLIGNVYGELTFLQDFKFRTSVSINDSRTDTYNFQPVFFVKSDERRDIAALSRGFSKSVGWTTENLLTFNKTIGTSNISAMLGYTSEYASNDGISGSKQTFPSNDEYQRVLASGSTLDNITGNLSNTSMESIFGRLNYSYRDKYLFTGSVRRDGSSKFGEGNKWGTFPSFSLGWRLNEEAFFQSLNANIISNLKLRAGWGTIGNQSLSSNYAYLSTIRGGNRYVISDVVQQGYLVGSIGTPDIKWETTAQSNFGVDLGLFENALALNFDYYMKATKDMLLQVPIPSYAGYGSAIPWTNAGEVKNNGFEVVLTYQGGVSDVTYNASLNGSRFTNEVISLGGGSRPIISGPNRTEVGSSIGRFYGWVTDGIFQSEEEVLAYSQDGVLLQRSAHAGDFRFKDLNSDGTVNDLDKTWIGNPLPEFTYGTNLSVGYKGFDLSVFMQGSYGNDIYNSVKGRISLAGYFNGFESSYLRSWRGEGTSNNQPIMTTVNANDNYRISDWYIEDGSYLRLKNIQLGYNLPKSFSTKFGVQNARIWVGGTNLITFTKYSGFDPEIGLTSNPVSAGNDSFAYPQTKEVSFGIRLTM